MTRGFKIEFSPRTFVTETFKVDISKLYKTEYTYGQRSFDASSDTAGASPKSISYTVS